jgi:hypothetical protein
VAQDWQAELKESLEEWQAEGSPDLGRHPAAERMAELAESFHALRGRPGVRPWSPLALAREAYVSGALSGPTQLAAGFVLKVWNRDFACPEFDVLDALQRWDRHHRAAFLAWAADPWWP